MTKLYILKVESANGNSIYPVVLEDERDVVLFDCGYPGYLPNVKAAAEKARVDLAGLTRIVITHHDFDHIGALAEFKAAYPQVKVYASEEQAPYIAGEKKSLRLQQFEAKYDSLPDEQKEGSRRVQAMFASVKPVEVDVVVNANEVLHFCGGIKIIPTPGHMPGHISPYLQEFKTLVSGDALTARDGILGSPNIDYTLDIAAAMKSVQSLLNYDIEKIVCYHGGVCVGDIKAALTRVINN
ncbi:MAG: MBL fold metallo-hydrolase [bacterium]